MYILQIALLQTMQLVIVSLGPNPRFAGYSSTPTCFEEELAGDQHTDFQLTHLCTARAAESDARLCKYHKMGCSVL